jgi:hypothetical protein
MCDRSIFAPKNAARIEEDWSNFESNSICYYRQRRMNQKLLRHTIPNSFLLIDARFNDYSVNEKFPHRDKNSRAERIQIRGEIRCFILAYSWQI